MSRIVISLAAALLVSSTVMGASAQTTAQASPATPTTSRMKLTRQSLKEMRIKWSQNRGKLRACRAEVKVKGLAGDDRWFYIEDCMAKS